MLALWRPSCLLAGRVSRSSTCPRSRALCSRVLSVLCALVLAMCGITGRSRRSSPKKKPPGHWAQGADSASAMWRSPSGKEQGLDQRVLTHDGFHADKSESPGQAHHLSAGSTLHDVRGVMRGLGRSIVVAGLVALGAAVARAALGRLSGDRDTPSPSRGSFDTWPTVLHAPERPVPNGSRTPAGG